MSDLAALYDHLANLVRYPDEGSAEALAAAEAVLVTSYPSAAEHVARFREAAAGWSLSEREEHFTRTFDVTPQVCLEVGWHLFGEQYERGSFLVYMRHQLRSAGVEESTELPDHLTHVLQLLGRTDEEIAAQLTRESVRPALDKMRAALEPTDNPYRWVLEAIHIVCSTRHPGGPSQMPIAAAPRIHEGLGDPLEEMP